MNIKSKLNLLFAALFALGFVGAAPALYAEEESPMMMEDEGTSEEMEDGESVDEEDADDDQDTDDQDSDDQQDEDDA